MQQGRGHARGAAGGRYGAVCVCVYAWMNIMNMSDGGSEYLCDDGEK